MSLPSDVLSSASTLIRVMQDNGCAGASPSAVSAFQSAFNAHYTPVIGVDGKYGPQTQGALAHVIVYEAAGDDDGVYGMNAPSPCSYTTTARMPSGAPAVHAAPAPGPSPSMNVASASAGGSMFSSPWTWAIVLAGAAAVAISRSKHPPKWARKMGLHR